MAGFLFRFLVSAAVASVGVIGLLAAGISIFEPDIKDPVTAMHEVEVVNLAENPELAEMIRKEREKYREPEPASPPPPEPLPQIIDDRRIEGFVQLEYTINADGTVSDVRVVGAAPRGVYEQEAVRRIEASMHVPKYENGEPVASRTSEVVEFSVPVSELKSPARSQQ